MTIVEEAEQADQRSIAPQQILRGLLREDHCPAQLVLAKLGVTLPGPQVRTLEMDTQGERNCHAFYRKSEKPA
jgi:hypothetical protein